MRMELKNQIRLVSCFAERRGRFQARRRPMKRLVSPVLSFVLMVLAVSVGAQEAIEHGYFLKSAAVNPEVPRISASEVKKLFDDGKLILVNAMEAENFRADHIVGSISMRNLSPTKRVEDAQLPQNVIVAFY